MNKRHLVKAIKRETGLTKSECESVLKIFFDEISNTLARGDRVEIRGFCSFHIKKYEAYTGRNPKTSEPTRVDPKKLPVFRCGEAFKKRVNNKTDMAIRLNQRNAKNRRVGKDRRWHDAKILESDRRGEKDRRRNKDRRKS